MSEEEAPKGFVELLELLLVQEKGYQPDVAKRLIKENPDVVTRGIMHGPGFLRATAMALEFRNS